MKKFWILFAVSFSLFCLSPSKAFSESSEPGENTLETDSTQKSEAFSVKVVNSSLSGKERLISMTVITKEEIKRCIGCDLTDILERAGVQVRRFHESFSQSSDTDTAYVTLRGASDPQVLLLVDGVRQEDRMLSEPVWTFIPVHHIERIEVVKGPQSSYHGNSAIGGVIHIFTQKADCLPGKMCAKGSVHLSNESNTGHTVHLSANTRTDRSGIRLGVQGDQSKDPEKSGNYRESAVTLQFDHKTKNGKWLIEGHSSFYDNHDKGEPLNTVDNGDSDVVSLGTTYYMSPDLLFKALLGYNREEQNYTDNLTNYKSRRISLKLFGEYHFEFAEGNYTLTTGGERQIERIGSNPDNIYDQKKRDTDAVFSNLHGEQGPLSYQVAVRMDDLSGDIKKQVFTWSGAVSYHLLRIKPHDLFLRGGVGTGFRAPGFDEQFYRDEWYRGNPNLKLEKSRTYEIGLRLEEKGGSYFLDIATFRTKLKNPVINSADEEGYDTLAQQRSATLRGIEVQTQLVKGPWNGKAQYTYTDTDNTEDLRAHNPVHHLASLRIGFSPTPKLTLETELVHRGKREDDSTPGDSINLLNLYGFYDINDKLRLGLALHNATDKKYDQYYYTEGPRRTVWLTLEVLSF